MKKRVTCFDFLRGIAIIMVIGIHTCITSTFSEIDVYVRQTINCAVPIFLAISGYFLTKNKEGIFKDFKGFSQKQITRVYIPAIIWSLPLFALSIYKINDGTMYQYLKNIAMLLFCGYSIYYFIALIIQCYLSFRLFTLLNNLGGVIITFIISCTSILLCIYIRQLKGVELPLLIYAGPIIAWCVYFMIGCYLADRKRDYSLWLPLVLAMIFLAAQYYDGITKINYGVFKISTLCFNCSILFILFSEKLEKQYNAIYKVLLPIKLIGSISFGIYLTHLYFVRFVKFENWYFRWFVLVIISVGFVYLLTLFIPKKIHKYWGL